MNIKIEATEESIQDLISLLELAIDDEHENVEVDYARILRLKNLKEVIQSSFRKELSLWGI